MLSLRFPRGNPSPKPQPWLRFIHACNGIEEIFGKPDVTATNAAGDYVEEYEDADVIFPGDDPITVRIVAKTERGNRVMAQASGTDYTSVTIDGAVVAQSRRIDLEGGK